MLVLHAARSAVVALLALVDWTVAFAVEDVGVGANGANPEEASSAEVVGVGGCADGGGAA